VTGTNVQHIPYRTTDQAVTSLLAGDVDFAFNALPLVLPNIKAGKIKALAVAGSTRATVLPDVPTFAEAGVAGYDTNTWIGLFAPAATPNQLVLKIQLDVSSVLKQRAIVDLLVNQGIEPVGSAPNQFAATIEQDTTKWASVIKAAGVKPQ
jgi:tripartite-type tricarboxylate transporter receptor subunit TctC